jgi:hypothetical protein
MALRRAVLPAPSYPITKVSFLDFTESDLISKIKSLFFFFYSGLSVGS